MRLPTAANSPHHSPSKLRRAACVRAELRWTRGSVQLCQRRMQRQLEV